MPFYDYQCSKCDHTFEEFLRMADRKKPTKNPCSRCQAIGSVNQVILQAPAACDPIRVGSAGRLDWGFKEVIKKIKTAHPRHTMKDY
jgi:putative FmdB family regulatory protein